MHFPDLQIQKSQACAYENLLKSLIFDGSKCVGGSIRKIIEPPYTQCEFKGFAKTTRFCSLRGTAVGAAPLREQKPVRFPCPAGLDIVEPHVQIEEEAVSTDPEGIY